jgi:cyclic pyranopterin phosphate synthase
MIEIYADGACLGNPGPGGWAAIIVDGDKRQELKGRVDKTTNNRMELMGVIEGMARTPEGSEVVVRSDSQYLVFTMSRRWKRKANLDLWQKLDDLTAKRKADWVWVKGHDGHPENERAHQLANEAMARVIPTPTHFDSSGQVHMVDVSEKATTERVAIAKGTVKMKASTLALIEQGEIAKGNVLSIAQTAGIMAAKKTQELIPLCHPLRITNVTVEFQTNKDASAIEITATVKAAEKTGVEMEALTAVAVSALTIYDMCKAVDRGMTIENIRLVHKSGGKSGTINLK